MRTRVVGFALSMGLLVWSLAGCLTAGGPEAGGGEAIETAMPTVSPGASAGAEGTSAPAPTRGPVASGDGGEAGGRADAGPGGTVPPSPVPSQPGAGPVADGELAPYRGPVEHIFFHPLIVDPSLAFDGDGMSRGYDDWFVTIREFERILVSLYENQYVLIDIGSLYAIGEEQGRTVVIRNELLLPEGKKPLILSIDDLNYYEYMIENGNAHKLVLDPDGRVTAYIRTRSGKEVVSREIEIVPIVDRFVEAHPDFSFRGGEGGHRLDRL